jgi:hypothetical protein
VLEPENQTTEEWLREIAGTLETACARLAMLDKVVAVLGRIEKQQQPVLPPLGSGVVSLRRGVRRSGRERRIQDRRCVRDTRDA